MSVDRDGKSTPGQAEELLRLLEEMKDQNRVEELIGTTDDDKVEDRDFIITSNNGKSAETRRKIIEIQASDIGVLRLKAHAVLRSIGWHDDMHELDQAIEEAGSYESLALSVVRDLLRSPA